MYWPAKALPWTMSSSGVTLSAAKTLSSTIGPAGEDSTWGQVWSFGCFRVKTTVVGSGAVVPLRLPSRYDGPLAAAILTCRSKVNFTSAESSALPLAHLRFGFSFTVYWVGEVNEADSAMSGLTSGLP